MSGTSNTTLAWEVCCASVQGASHLRSGLQNQDAFRWEAFGSVDGNGVVLAVADGHGNAKSFRSDLGAKFAVQVASETLLEFAKSLDRQSSLAVVERALQIDLPRTIVQRWQTKVDEHRKVHPFVASEIDAISPDDRKKVEDMPPVAYGSTLLAVLLTDQFIAYLQLGDGDILVVTEKGEVSRPLPSDERLLANETTSLCSPGPTGKRHLPNAGPTGAWVDFRSRLEAVGPTPPGLILVSTDGYANSFSSPAGFVQVGPDIWELLRSKGRSYVEANLKTWLAEASHEGSGDDVTVGMLYRRETIDKAQPASQENTVSPAGEQPPATATAPQASAGPQRSSWFRRIFSN